MTKRYDVAAPRDYTDRDGNKKTSWNNLGVAFEKDGRISILLNALPMPGADGQAKLILMEPKLDDRGGRDVGGADNRTATQSNTEGRRAYGGGGGFADDLNDSVPF